jgi:hypothetical protein
MAAELGSSDLYPTMAYGLFPPPDLKKYMPEHRFKDILSHFEYDFYILSHFEYAFYNHKQAQLSQKKHGQAYGMEKDLWYPCKQIQ